jgi:hypothetical protein
MTEAAISQLRQDEPIEVRCPVGPQRLLALVRARKGEKPTYKDGGTIVEFACSDCARTYRKQGRKVIRVLHQYNFLGEFVSTWIEE